MFRCDECVDSFRACRKCCEAEDRASAPRGLAGSSCVQHGALGYVHDHRGRCARCDRDEAAEPERL